MSVFEWDKVGERVYQTGVDRGVLYLKDGTSVAWNGLTGVDEDSNSERKSYYLDGVKYLESVTPEDFSGKLKAFTYPEEFDQVNGVAHVSPGLSFYEQPPKSFSLSYRTKIGNDVDGDEHGYKIHLLYNLLASPDSHTFESIKNPLVPVEFAWSLSGVPQIISGYRPTVHISIDSRDTPAELLSTIEDILYGTDEIEPRIPSVYELEVLFTEVTPFDELIFVSADESLWAVTATDDGTIDVSVIASAERYISQLTLLDPTDDRKIVWVDDTGGLNVDDSPDELDPRPYHQVIFRSPDTSLWIITATADDHLDIAPG